MSDDHSVPPDDWRAAFAKLEARIDALEQRLGDGRIVPKTLRVKDTGIVLEVEQP